MASQLSAHESAGLFVLRRARTVAGPQQARMVLTAFLGLLVVDLVRIWLGRPADGEALPWTAPALEALSWVALAVMLWLPVWGLGLAGLVVLGALVQGPTGMEPLLLVVAGAVTGWRATRRIVTMFVVGAVAAVAATALRYLDHWLFLVGWLGGAALVGFAAGYGFRRWRSRGDREGRRGAEVVLEDARLRADERSILTRELHDVVTHQLSNITLQVMSRGTSTDPAELRRALTRIGRSADSALSELRMLVRVLRDLPTTATPTQEVAELNERVPPTSTAAEWARRLVEAGFEPVFDLPAEADRLEMTVQQTVTRALNTTLDNVVRYAAPRSQCEVTLTVNPAQVILRVASALPPGQPAQVDSLGWGLRGLRERIGLTGGTFSVTASPTWVADDPLWVVTATLRRD